MTLRLLRIGLVMGVAWLSGNAHSYGSSDNWEEACCRFSAAGEGIKQSIVVGIRSYPTNVVFTIAKPLHGRQLRDFNRFANSRLQMFPLFGLDSLCPIMIGRGQGIGGNGEVAYLYKSKLEVESIGAWRSIISSDETYNRPSLLYAEAMKLFFMEQITVPIAERFDASTTIMMGGKSLMPTFETALEDLRIDRKKFDEVFANHVFMRCFCGPFGIEEETAKKIIEHDAKGAELRMPKQQSGFGKLVYLDGREISEVVYWLWKRKGKTGEYSDFVKAHSELFEPIAAVSEFRTELGNRLLGTWK